MAERKSARNELKEKENLHEELGQLLEKLPNNRPAFGVEIIKRYLWIVRGGGFSMEKQIACAQRG